MAEGICKENVLLALYEGQEYSNQEGLYTREVTEEIVGRRATNREVILASKILRRQRQAGRTEALNGRENGKKNTGKKLKYALTENGGNYAEILYKSDWYCENCQDFVEVVKRPTCKDCGAPVHREKT